MMNKIEQIADTLKSESRQIADRAIKGMRTAGHETAGLIVKTKRPVHAIANTGLKLNNLSHKSIEKMLKQQVRMIDELIDGSAERIETAARARTLKGLVDGQVSTLPKTRKHVVKNAKKTVSLARDTGDAFGDLFKDVVVDISSARKGGKPAAKKKAAGRPAAKKKAPGRKPAAKKTVAKKRVARKAPAKKVAEATQAA